MFQNTRTNSISLALLVVVLQTSALIASVQGVALYNLQ